MALDDSGDQFRVTSYRYIVIAMILLLLAIGAGLYFNREFGRVPARIAESDETMLKTDSMRHGAIRPFSATSIPVRRTSL